ncbi:MAG: Asp-tRNA(Asn)/Glu-tRNA(Gln) amidotransferase subunit GatB [Candidatus Sungbacteria bacterium]|nr:Asp-tRNA(Asn)/Glu-tRNA(Gln) amidotransferase subunit GatB [Candidatus Sungbacteria bacterium]
MKYAAVIGLEIHAELNTKTKMFCSSLNDPDEKHPNINICPVCMGHPGTLPTINEDAVKKVVSVGLALGGDIAEFSQFDRKNYFYPDLPKGYQISQYEYPLVKGGMIEVMGRPIQITRIHLEEDTGRLIHDKSSQATLVDFNRAGVPLMELVTEPDIRTGEEVRLFGEALQRILRYVGASDADMEKGQMRVEVNISLRPEKSNIPLMEVKHGEEKNFIDVILDENGKKWGVLLGTKVEVKNINSFKYAADAVDYEIRRQSAILDRGEKVVQETRGWNEHKGESFSQRSKESAHDYRYFPEPDLPPLNISRDFVAEIRTALPELPRAKQERFIREYGLEQGIAEILIREKHLADYFEAAISEARQHDKETDEKPRKNLAHTIAALITGELLHLMREAVAEIRNIRITPENMGELADMIAEDKISNLAAKQILAEMFASGEDPSDIAERLGLWQMSGTADLEDIARHIIKENPAALEDYKKGKTASLQFLMGQVMKESRGTANPTIVRRTLKRLIEQNG